MYYFYYLTPDEHVVRIRASRKPSKRNAPSRGTWILQEQIIHPISFDKKWTIGCAPEITWFTLSGFTYIGRVLK
jgi:hypothetical protein